MNLNDVRDLVDQINGLDFREERLRQDKQAWLVEKSVWEEQKKTYEELIDAKIKRVQAEHERLQVEYDEYRIDRQSQIDEAVKKEIEQQTIKTEKEILKLQKSHQIEMEEVAKKTQAVLFERDKAHRSEMENLIKEHAKTLAEITKNIPGYITDAVESASKAGKVTINRP